MSPDTLCDLVTHMREQAAAYCESSKVPGYLAGVYHDGAQIVVAHGAANLVTGASMQEDTGFLFGSITKVMTALGIQRLFARTSRLLPRCPQRPCAPPLCRWSHDATGAGRLRSWASAYPPVSDDMLTGIDEIAWQCQCIRIC
jgi:beta-lactamase family protein